VDDGELKSLVVDDWSFPRRRRCATGDDGGLGDGWIARNAAEKGRGKISLDAPERGEMEGGFQVRGGGFTASESTAFDGGTCELR
jgi:hypothetical protein